MSLSIKASVSDIEKHELDINSIVFANNCVFSGADDGKIKKWDENLKFICEVQAHPCSVFCLTVANNKIYSCSNDGSIRSFSVDDLSVREVILEDCESEIWKICYNNDTLFAGTDTGIVMIYKNDKYFSQFEMLEPVKDLIVIDNMMFTARDLELAITEIIPGNKGRFVNQKMIRGRAPLAVVGNKICLSSREGKDIIINENSASSHYKETAVAKAAHEMIINAICGAQQGDKIFLYSGGWDKTVKQWDITCDKCTLCLSCPVDIIVNAFCIGSEGQVYCAGGDGKVLRLLH